MCPSLVLYASGHGFGHATRDAALIEALAAARDDLRFIVRTPAPGWIFSGLIGAHVDVEPLETDTGVTQVDSLRLDEEDTARRAAAFYAQFDRRADEEAAVLRRLGAAIVVGDIPPLAFEAGARAGVPSIALGNFTWDWIYRAYPSFDRIAPGTIDVISRAYAKATHALRLPLHGGFESMHAVTEDIPFIARQSRIGRSEARRKLGVADGRPVVLPSFGGHGLDLPYGAIGASCGFTLLTPGTAPAGVRYEDLVAAADVVVSKPGYGIVSECVANGAALLYTSRGRFPEYQVFVEQMPRILRCRHLSQEDLRAGRWAEALRALLDQPGPSGQPRIDGAAVAARSILDWGMGVRPPCAPR